MTKNMEENLRPDMAASEIHRVENRVQSSRRWHIISMLALGIFAIAFFALVGWVPHEAIPSSLYGLISFVPVILYVALQNIRKSNPPTSGRELRNLELRLGNIFVWLLLVAVAIDFFLLKPYQGTVLAAFTGILPAIPCFYGAWKVSRK